MNDASFASRREFLQAGTFAAAASLAVPHATATADDAREATFDLSIPCGGPRDRRLESFDQMLAAFLTLFEVPGASLAVARRGKLVYARGMGFSDRGTKSRVQPQSLFRIASVSKPVTSVAVLQLIQQGRLQFDDRVLDILKIEPFVEDGGSIDPLWKEVTVRQLLQHRGGWDREKSFDPMFRSVEIARTLGVEPPARAIDVIRYMLGKPLDFTPGERAAYSNFGYCLLGRIIEQATGQPYDEAVRERIFTPLGINRPRLGKTLPEGKAEGEVAYHVRGERTGPAVVGVVGREVPLPYGAWSIEAMDAHGGWIASAVDLVRFASALDADSPVPLLNDASRARMLARPDGDREPNAEGKPNSNYLACGWMAVPLTDGRMNSFHTGSLDGTAALLVRRHDGLVWSVLFNTRATPNGEHLAQAIDPLVHFAADKVREWPDVDLFADFL